MCALDVSPSSLCKKSKFSRKTMHLVALQRDQELRATFATDVSLYALVFVDETGCNRRDALRKDGYRIRGKPVKCQKLLVRGERISVIAAMTTEGVLDLMVCASPSGLTGVLPTGSHSYPVTIAIGLGVIATRIDALRATTSVEL